jgi:predicted ribosome-associated RNA-binding protein Tma20
MHISFANVFVFTEGELKMSTKDITSINKGIGVINQHYLNDGLWFSKTVA